MNNDYITTRQYANLHGLSIETVRNRVKKNQIAHIKVGNSIMIDRNTPWEYRQEGRPRKNPQQSEVGKRKKEYDIKITRAYYVSIEDNTGKEVMSDFTFLPMDEAVKLGERMKSEVEAKTRSSRKSV